MFGKLGDVAELMKQAGAMRENIERVRAEIDAAECVGTSPGGEVEVVVGGDFTIRAVRVDAERTGEARPDDVAESFMAAANDALVQVKENAKKEMGRLTGGLDLSSFLKS